MPVVLMLQGKGGIFTLFSGKIYLSNAFCCSDCSVLGILLLLRLKKPTEHGSYCRQLLQTAFLCTNFKAGKFTSVCLSRYLTEKSGFDSCRVPVSGISLVRK